MKHPSRLRLLARIQRRYQTIAEPLRVGSLEILFTRVADPDRVLDEVAEEEDRLERISGRRADEDALHLPYWAELWDSAMGIAAFLVERQEIRPFDHLRPVCARPFRGVSVLDLGCGMGLTGTVAAALGAKVLFADLESPPMLFSRLNSLSYARQVRTRQLNWQKDVLSEKFDVILGADILYERKQWDFLEPFWREHLAESGEVLLGEPGRQTGDHFIDWIAARHWRLERFERSVPTRQTPVRILRLTRPR